MQRVFIQQGDGQKLAQCTPGVRDRRDRSRSAFAVSATEAHLHTQRLESILRRNEVFQVKALLRNHHQPVLPDNRQSL